MPEFCRQISITLNDRNQNGMGFNYHRGHFLKAGSERYRVILPHNPAPIVRPVHLRTGYGHITLDKWCSSHLSCLSLSWQSTGLSLYELFLCILMTERSLRLVGVVAPTPRRATSTNIQFAIFNFQFLFLRVWISAVIIMAGEFFY